MVGWDVVHVDYGDIATNMFNDYFVNLGKNITDSNGGNNVNHLDYMIHINQPNYFFFRQIHCYSTEKLICSLNKKIQQSQYYSCENFKINM